VIAAVWKAYVGRLRPTWAKGLEVWLK
jgi:hypothetical protein